MADTVTYQDFVNPATGESLPYAIIDHGNGQFTSMPKSVYDTLPSELSTPTTPQAGE